MPGAKNIHAPSRVAERPTARRAPVDTASSSPASLPGFVVAPDVVVDTARTLAELERYRGFQLRHQWHPESNYELLQAALESRDDSSRPHVLVLLRAGRPEAMLVGQVVPATAPWTLGYKVVHESPLQLFEVLHGGLMGDLSRANVQGLYQAVAAFLRAGGADAVLLRNIRTDSEIHRVFQGQTPWLRRDGAARRSMNWKMTLPPSYAEYRRRLKRKSREDLRRYEKRIRMRFGDEVAVVPMNRPDEVARAVMVIDAIASKTYQRGLGAGFQPTREARARWGAAARNDWLRVYVLYLGGEPAAFCSGFALGNTLWLEHIGFDPEVAACQPGGFLLQRVLEIACGEDALEVLDFGVGDADYKRRLCDQHNEETAIYVFAPSLKGLWLSSMRRLTNWIGAAGRWAFSRLGVLEGIKRRWRRRIAERQKVAP